MADLSIDQWIAELEAIHQTAGHENGLTVNEMMDVTGQSRRRIQKLLKTAKQHGRLVAGRARRENIIGETNSIPVYRILPAKDPKNGK